MASSSSPSVAPKKVRDLQPVVHAIPGSSDHLRVVYGRPSTTAALGCTWESALYGAMPDWFETVGSASWDLGLGFVYMSSTRIVARMRVEQKHRQPAGLLHGGISALISEDLGSVASAINARGKPIVGINVTATHLGSARIGDMIVAICTPIKRGGNLQIWKTEIFIDDEQKDASVAFSTEPLHYRDYVPKTGPIVTSTLQSLTRPMPTKPSQPSTAVAINSKL